VGLLSFFPGRVTLSPSVSAQSSHNCSPQFRTHHLSTTLPCVQVPCNLRCVLSLSVMCHSTVHFMTTSLSPTRNVCHYQRARRAPTHTEIAKSIKSLDLLLRSRKSMLLPPCTIGSAGRRHDRKTTHDKIRAEKIALIYV